MIILGLVLHRVLNRDPPPKMEAGRYSFDLGPPTQKVADDWISPIHEARRTSRQISFDNPAYDRRSVVSGRNSTTNGVTSGRLSIFV